MANGSNTPQDPPRSVPNPYATPDLADTSLSLLLWNEHWFGPGFEASLVVKSPWGARIHVEFSTDRRDLADASAVVFHGPTLAGLPQRRAGQPWVMFSMEANRNYPQQSDPKVLRGFDLTMSYRLDSDVPCPYVNRRQYGDFGPPPERDEPTDRGIACFIASNPVPGRDRFVAELMEHIRIDSFGTCLNNRSIRDLVEPGLSDSEEALATIASYPFYLAFENTRDVDYVTEKLYRPLSVGTVPVYYGAPNVGSFLPSPDAAVVIDDDTIPERLAGELQRLAEDTDELAARVSWHATPSENFTRLLQLGDVSARARLATKLAHGCGPACRCGGRLRTA